MPPTEMDDWAEFEQLMYQCSMRVSEMHGKASELFRARKEISECADAIVAPIGKLKAVRKSAVPALLEKAAELAGDMAIVILKEASATGDLDAYGKLSDAYSFKTSDEKYKLLSEAYGLVSQRNMV